MVTEVGIVEIPQPENRHLIALFTAFYLTLLVRIWEHYGSTFLPERG
jgi:hypothetical protein